MVAEIREIVPHTNPRTGAAGLKVTLRKVKNTRTSSTEMSSSVTFHTSARINHAE
jgi:hypothetical protein